MLPVLALVALHAPHRSDGFVGDDAVAAQCAARPLFGLLADPRDALCYSGVHFTPLLPASFKVDWALSGLDPTAARAHNLLIATALVVAALLVLTRLTSTLVGSLLTTAWVLSPPFTLVTGWLVTRQYVWGLLLSGVALALHRFWLDRDDRLALIGSVLAYLTALLWKDVYLPVVVLIAIFTPGTLRRRLVAAVPFVATAIVYLGWRIAILGGLGGYAEIGLSPEALVLGIARSPWVTFAELFGSGWLSPLPFLIGGVGAALELGAVWSAVAAPLAVVYPSSPVGAFEMRYLFPCSAVAIWMIARALAPWPKAIGGVVASLLLAASLCFALPRSLSILEELRAAGSEGEALLALLESTPCRRVTVVGLARTPQWFATGMQRLHAERLGRSLPRAVLVGDLASRASRGLQALDDAGRDCGLFAYADGKLTRTGGEVARAIDGWLAERTGAAPLLTATASGHAVDLQWTPVDGAVRYLLFYGEESEIYTAALPVPRPRYPARNLPEGRYFFRVAAVGPGESIGALSEQVEVIVREGVRG